eukprot:396094_1
MSTMSDHQIWNVIQSVLNKSTTPMDVLAIKRSSNVLNQQTKGTLNKILYNKKDQGLIHMTQPNKNAKPLWYLPQNAYSNNNYNSHKKLQSYNPKPSAHTFSGQHSFDQNHAPSFTPNFTHGRNNNYIKQKKHFQAANDILLRYKQFSDMGYKMEYQQFYQLNGDIGKCIDYMESKQKQFRQQIDQKQQDNSITESEHDVYDQNGHAFCDTEIQPKPAHISSIISTPFCINQLDNDLQDKNVARYYASTKNDEYISCFIYYIRYESDPYHVPIGIILPKRIDNEDLKSIKFPVQIRKAEEKQLKQLINGWVENGTTLPDSVEFDEKYLHDTHITLHLVRAKGDQYEHKLKRQCFEMFKECDKFMFRVLDPTINLCNNYTQKRHYIICVLNQICATDDMEIDYRFMQRIYLGSGNISNKKLNAKQFRKKLRTSCSLKDEIVQIIDDKKRTKKLAISYGVDKRKFKRIRSNKDERKIDNIDDTKSEVASIASLQSFAASEFVQKIAKFKGVNNTEKMLKKAPVEDYVLVRVENPIIENVLRRAKDKKLVRSKIKLTMGSALISTVFPTGITANLWNKLKTIPAILYRIEQWCNIIDLKQELVNIYETKSNDEEKKSNDAETIPMNIVLKLLFEVMHRSSSTTQMNYQILHGLGSSVLNFLSYLFLFINQPLKDPKQIYWKGITYSQDIFLKTAKRLNLLKYGIWYDFKHEKWSPAQFEDRTINSLYDLNTPFNTIKTGNSKYIQSNMLKSVIGAIFVSFIQNKRGIGDAINVTLRFLNCLGIFIDIQKETIFNQYISGANCVETNDAISQFVTAV